MKDRPRPRIPDWRYHGQVRPEWATASHEGQESVWDYPRPPRIENESREVVVRVGEFELARTRRSVRILETAGPPTFYLPVEDVEMDALAVVDRESACEWKGYAKYLDYQHGTDRVREIGWTYPDPYTGFESIRNWISFYPARATCTVDGERVRPQPGIFYGGWVTNEIVGPFKGEPGSETW